VFGGLDGVKSFGFFAKQMAKAEAIHGYPPDSDIGILSQSKKDQNGRAPRLHAAIQELYDHPAPFSIGRITRVKPKTL
jgi:hypothetical protein